ncbi:hypothetical protein PXNS11_320086 [Stutzerimonas xanthomarina]|nr:hypothetical protein PXNS11_320086 [Stutzerimonas xanthomarina]
MPAPVRWAGNPGTPAIATVTLRWIAIGISAARRQSGNSGAALLTKTLTARRTVTEEQQRGSKGESPRRRFRNPTGDCP